ncbi:MAG: N-acetyl-gamma-glutamyl-phosphate reductase, partial [Chloroflexaceae bacterium]|nr:N-acetyl-gamma-glutamyl-phosphate reductase [Chloroflexaceae bacterium]
MIRVGIYGATGYAGIELVKLLQRHPQAKIVFATSRSEAGKSLADVYPTLINLPLVDPETVDPTQADVIFTCLPHGAAELVPIVRQALELGVRVVDFSDTFRLSDAGRYERHMGKTHPAPDLLRQTVYGMPEIHRERIHSAQLVGNTGCYPVTVILALHPLVQAGLLADPVVIADC